MTTFYNIVRHLVFTSTASCIRFYVAVFRRIMAENAEGGGAQTSDGYDYKRLHSFPLIKKTDMSDEMCTEAMELCVTACEKFSTNNESAAKMIKDAMDKKFGSSWHAVVGEGFGFEITHEVSNLLYMFFGGTMAICVWKCS